MQVRVFRCHWVIKPRSSGGIQTRAGGRMIRRAGVARSFALVLVPLALAACTETRFVSGGIGMKGLKGAEGGVWLPGEAPPPGVRAEELIARAGAKAVGTADSASPRAPSGSEDANPDATTDETMPQWRVRQKDGTVRLISTSPRHVLHHLVTTLDGGEYDLMEEQVLSAALKDRYRRAGRTSFEAVDELAARLPEIRDLYATIPMGEQTPGVLVEVIGKNRFRIRSPSAQTLGLRLTTIDVVIEDFVYRLDTIR